jgi:hypothetical protein
MISAYPHVDSALAEQTESTHHAQKSKILTYVEHDGHSFSYYYRRSTPVYYCHYVYSTSSSVLLTLKRRHTQCGKWQGTEARMTGGQGTEQGEPEK